MLVLKLWYLAKIILFLFLVAFLTSPGVLPAEAPEEPEPLKNILQDVDKYIMPGVGTF